MDGDAASLATGEEPEHQLYLWMLVQSGDSN